MTHANVVAAAAIEGRLPEVYAENYNYGTWQVESAVGADTAFALQDASTVQKMCIRDRPRLPNNYYAAVLPLKRLIILFHLPPVKAS